METRRFVPVNSEQVEKAVGSKRFIHRSACGCGHPIHTFTRVGETIEGRLRTCDNHDRADRAACAHLHYITATGGEAVLAIRLTKWLRRVVDKETTDKPRLWGKVVRITYKGSIPTKFGHAEKVFLVSVDHGSITPDFQEVKNDARKNAKPRERRPVRRPANRPSRAE